MNTKKQTTHAPETTQTPNNERKLILLRERKYGKYTVRTFQPEMSPAEHLQWLQSVYRVILSATTGKPSEATATRQPPKRDFTHADLLGPTLSPKKYKKRRQKLLKELKVAMAKEKLGS
jgi:hypothetical protein